MLLLWLGCAISSEKYTVRLAQNTSPANPLIVHRKELIELALKAAGYLPEVEFCELPGGGTTDRRMIQEVLDGRRCDVMATSSGGDASTVLRAVPVPIYLGGGGLRIWLMNARSLQRMQATGDEDLQHYRLSSGPTWNDTRIWELNGFRVEKADYDQLFKMLALDRFDAFPRSVFEISSEFATLDPAVYAIEPHLIFHMNTGIFFYVTPYRLHLAHALEVGLRRLYCSGEFERFMQTQASTRSAFQLLLGRSRRMVELRTPGQSAVELKALRDYAPSWSDAHARAQTCAKP